MFGAVAERSVAGITIPIVDPTSLDVVALLIATVAFAGMVRYRWSIVPVVLGSGLAGFLVKTVLR